MSRSPQGSNRNPSLERLAYTIQEVADALGISEKSVDVLIATNAIGSILIGKRARRVTRRQLDDYLRSLEEDSGWTPAA